jgi:hypothetical protein
VYSIRIPPRWRLLSVEERVVLVLVCTKGDPVHARQRKAGVQHMIDLPRGSFRLPRKIHRSVRDHAKARGIHKTVIAAQRCLGLPYPYVWLDGLT